MKFKILNSPRTVDRDIYPYLVKWDSIVKRGGKKNFGQFQFKVKQFLKPYWKDHIVCEEFPIPAKCGDRGKSVDLINFTTNQIVEISGQQHYSYNEFFHKNNELKYVEQLKRDVFKEKWAELNNFDFFEIYETDNIDKKFFKEMGIL